MRASRALIGQPLPNERVEGAWGNREVPPHEAKEGGNVGETWFPPRERAEGERRSCRHPRVEVAGGDVVFADREELRPDDALSEGGVAAGPERAAVDRPVEPRRRAGDGDHR